jgi:two-component system sensor histidine kinase CpxA
MRFRFPLAARISLLAIANFAVLGLVFAGYVRLQLSGDMKSFLLSAARERIIAISRQIALDLQETSGPQTSSPQTFGEARTRLLQRYSAEYGVSFYLFLNDGEQIAGDPITLPPVVAARMNERPGPNSQGPGEPPPPGAEPPEGKGPPGRGPRGLPGIDPFLVEAETVTAPRYWLGVRMPVFDPRSRLPLHGTLLIVSSSLWTNSFFFQLKPWLVMGGVASIISVLCWFPFVRGTTRAVHRMLAATHTISTGRFDVDAASSRRDELGELGASINRMASQLDSLVRGQTRFLADAAHELRSPLGRMQLAAGILERGADEQEASYIADLKEDVETMSDLTDELLVFARAESLPAALSLRPVAVTPVIEKAARTEKRIGVDIEIEVASDLRVLADEDMLCRSVANVVRNSVRYAGLAGPVRLAARADDDHVEITISDCGPGVPEEELEKIFQPFYRLDESRNRRTGGAGLGLAIVKSCMEASGGTVTCHNRRPSGLETVFRLKRAV